MRLARSCLLLPHSARIWNSCAKTNPSSCQVVITVILQDLGTVSGEPTKAIANDLLYQKWVVYSAHNTKRKRSMATVLRPPMWSDQLRWLLGIIPSSAPKRPMPKPSFHGLPHMPASIQAGGRRWGHCWWQVIFA